MGGILEKLRDSYLGAKRRRRRGPSVRERLQKAYERAFGKRK
jgi:hypothetical protein